MRNLGRTDRIARAVLGIALIALALVTTTGVARILLCAVGAFSIIEASLSWCVIYALIGRNTCPVSAE